MQKLRKNHAFRFVLRLTATLLSLAVFVLVAPRAFAQAPDPANDAFQDWLIETCAGPLPPAEREQRLLEWEKAPSARYCHPREEHLLPLHVCSGLAAGAPARVVFDAPILGKRGVAFLW